MVVVWYINIPHILKMAKSLDTIAYSHASKRIPSYHFERVQSIVKLFQEYVGKENQLSKVHWPSPLLVACIPKDYFLTLHSCVTIEKAKIGNFC